MARVLVVGGTLFIGRAIVDMLLERGDEVVIMHRGTGTPWADRVGEIRCDRNDVAAVQEALAGDGFDVVFDNVYDWERGTTGEQVAASARAAANGLERYVFMSSVAVYP
jgi:2'-hydroxyisoflavone reductase